MIDLNSLAPLFPRIRRPWRANAAGYGQDALSLLLLHPRDSPLSPYPQRFETGYPIHPIHSCNIHLSTTTYTFAIHPIHLNPSCPPPRVIDHPQSASPIDLRATVRKTFNCVPRLGKSSAHVFKPSFLDFSFLRGPTSPHQQHPPPAQQHLTSLSQFLNPSAPIHRLLCVPICALACPHPP